MWKKLGGRKALFAALIIGLGFAVDFWTERGLTQNFVALCLGIYMALVTGNVVSKKVNVSKTNPAEKLDTTALESEVAAINEKIEATSDLLNTISRTASNTQKLILAARQSGNR